MSLYRVVMLSGDVMHVQLHLQVQIIFTYCKYRLYNEDEGLSNIHD